MPVKIRLQRQGRKKRPFYHIVTADSRSPRDGRYIERLGIYDPNTDPATVELNFDKALDWLWKGAQPTNTCRTILSAAGVLLKHHLLKGVKKGALKEEEVESKFNAWMKEKAARMDARIESIEKQTETETKKALDAETKVRDDKAKEIAKKRSKLAAEIEAADAPQDEVAGDEVTDEVQEQKTGDAEEKTGDAEEKTADAEEKIADTEEKTADAEEKIADTEEKTADTDKTADKKDDAEVKDEEVKDEEVKDEEVKDEEVKDAEVKDAEVKDEEVKDEEVKDEEVKDEEVKDEEKKDQDDQEKPGEPAKDTTS